MKERSSSEGHWLLIAALGVVYGDIGTSPLYALRECFRGTHAVAVRDPNVFGVLSLILWSLVLIISIKYLTVVMHANNNGEGGIMALLSLAFPDRDRPNRRHAVLIGMGVFGAALLYGDGMITPAISVLSAVEGLSVATPLFEPYIVPITIAVLAALFSVQRSGTDKVGSRFGPIMCVWFGTLAALGIGGIWRAPRVLAAINPVYAVDFLVENQWIGFMVLGAVFLVLTGGEALYADMGHFGVRPIRQAWFGLVLPALLLNYFGQGALLLQNPAAAENPFYRLAPNWLLYPMVGLSTLATVIASQALISGTFSVTMQAIQLGYFPRLAIRHTSSEQRGQIYIPYVNWTLMVACVALVLGFESSSRLAAAYGIAVSLTMSITTVLLYFAARRLWHWSRWQGILVCGFFLAIESLFLIANLAKVRHGGWVPLLVGGVVYTLMSTWQAGRRILRENLQASSLPLELFLESVQHHPPVRVPGTAVFMSSNPRGTPLALLHNLKHNKVLHERVIILTIATREGAHVEQSQRVRLGNLPNGFYRVAGLYGFMDQPSVPEVFERCKPLGLDVRVEDTTFFLSAETIIPGSRPRMALWRERLFAIMSRNAQRATTFFDLPANRVVELGMQVEL